MSGFKNQVEADNANVFMELDDFADKHSIIYDGDTYNDVPLIITKLKESKRHQLITDHAQGLYLVSATLHCKKSDIGGTVPERGTKIKISDEGFMRSYTVVSSACDMGMVRLELEAIDE